MRITALQSTSSKPLRALSSYHLNVIDEINAPRSYFLTRMSSQGIKKALIRASVHVFARRKRVIPILGFKHG